MARGLNHGPAADELRHARAGSVPRLPAITLTLRRHWLAAPRVVVGLAAKAEEAGWNGVYRPGPRALAGVGARQAADSWIVWGE